MALSQDQIDQMLSGDPSGDLTPQEKATLTELGAIAMGAGANVAHQGLGQKVLIGSPELSVSPLSALRDVYLEPVILSGYALALGGRNFPQGLWVRAFDGAVIFDLLMGRDGSNPDPDVGDMQISAVNELINQMLTAGATAMASFTGVKISHTLPATALADLTSDTPPPLTEGNTVVWRYPFSIEGVVDSELVQAMPLTIARGMLEQLSAKPAPGAPAAGLTARPSEPGIPQPVQFSPLVNPSLETAMPSGLDLIMDIPLRVTVELGGTKLKIKDVLELGRGSVIELHRLAGEPVDLLVNGKLMAKGEVVVINENFGLRITEILGRAEQLAQLNLK